MRLKIIIFCFCILFASIASGQSFDVFNGGRGHWWSPNDTYEVTIRTGSGATETYQMKFPVDKGDPNEALCTDGTSDAQLFWGTFENVPDRPWVLPERTPWCVIFVDANGYPLWEDPNNFTYYEPETAFGIGLDNIAAGTYANNYIQVYSLLDFDPNLLNVTIGRGVDDIATGPNNVTIGHGAGNLLGAAASNTLGGKDAGQYIVDTNDNTAWGYKAVGGGGAGTAASYPLLRTTTDQADPGLTHTTAIANATDLQNMQNDRAGNYYLTANIDLNGVSWTPIGLYTAETNFTNRFRGTLDGCGYTISNLSVNLSSGWNSSLMGCLGPGAKIANLTLSNVNIIGDDYYTAALASDVICADGSDDILIQNCHASGTITSSGGVFRSCGGLIGELSRKAGDSTSTIYVYDSTSSCTIDMSNATSGNYRGGFVGYVTRSTIKNCYATGNLTGGDGGDSSFGGFVGEISYSTISFCYATGDITGGNTDIGGFGGNIGDGTDVDSCYATGDVSGVGQVGGFGGQIEAGDVVPVDVYVNDCYSWGDAMASGAISGGFCGASSVANQHFDNCYSIGAATGTSSVGGFIGDAHVSLDVENCFWDTEASGNATTDQNKGTGHTTTWMKTKSNFEDAGWDFDTIWYMEGGNILAATGIGAYALSKIEVGGDYSVGLGAYAGENAVTTLRSIYLGPYAGYNQTTLDQMFVLDNRQRESVADESVSSLFYGYIAADANDSWLNINADVNMPKTVDVNELIVDDVSITGLLANAVIFADANGHISDDSTVADFSYSLEHGILDVNEITVTGTANHTYGINLSSGTWTNGVLNLDTDPNIYANGTEIFHLDTSLEGTFIGIGTRNGDKGDNNTFIGFRAGYNNEYGGGGNSNGDRNCYIGQRAGEGATGGTNNTGSENNALGCEALRYNTTGYENTCIGDEAGKHITTGNGNVAIGNDSMEGDGVTPVTGSYNTCVGTDTLYAPTSGSYNTAVGYQCLFDLTTGSYNVGVGYQALASLTTLNNVIGIGYQALHDVTDVEIGNIALGYQAGYYVNNTAGDEGTNNIFIGESAGKGTAASNTGYNNIGIGKSALAVIQSGYGNVALGNSAGISLTTGTRNFLVGREAGYSLTTGANNVYFGYQAGYRQTTSSDDVIVGYQAGYNSNGDTTLGNNVIIGYQSFYYDNGTRNIGIGYQSGYNNDTTGGGSQGDNNIYIGRQCGYGATPATTNTGYSNVGMGTNALSRNTTGYSNFALGKDSMFSNTTGRNNVAIGESSLYTNTTGYSNMTIGGSSMYYNIDGLNNVAIGVNALQRSTSGDNNVALGKDAIKGTASSTVDNNTCVGFSSGFSLDTNGNSNVFLGYKSGYNQTTNSNLLIIDNQDRGSIANEAAQSLIYGVFNATVANQILTINGKTKIGNATTQQTISTYPESTTLGVGAATFVISSNIVTLTGDVGGNTIATITGANAGTLLTIIFVDGNIQITDDNTHAANSVDLSAAFTSADDTTLQLVFDGTSWYETSRSVN